MLDYGSEAVPLFVAAQAALAEDNQTRVHLDVEKPDKIARVACNDDKVILESVPFQIFASGFPDKPTRVAATAKIPLSPSFPTKDGETCSSSNMRINGGHRAPFRLQALLRPSRWLSKSCREPRIGQVSLIESREVLGDLFFWNAFAEERRDMFQRDSCTPEDSVSRREHPETKRFAPCPSDTRQHFF